MIYKIKNIHFPDEDSVYIATDYSNIVMQYLIAYIQFTFYEIAPDYGLSPQQIGSILSDIYGFDNIQPTDYSSVIDMFDIWEKYYMAIDVILNIRIFQNEKLHNELIKQLKILIQLYIAKSKE